VKAEAVPDQTWRPPTGVGLALRPWTVSIFGGTAESISRCGSSRSATRAWFSYYLTAGDIATSSLLVYAFDGATTKHESADGAATSSHNPKVCPQLHTPGTRLPVTELPHAPRNAVHLDRSQGSAHLPRSTPTRRKKTNRACGLSITSIATPKGHGEPGAASGRCAGVSSGRSPARALEGTDGASSSSVPRRRSWSSFATSMSIITGAWKPSSWESSPPITPTDGENRPAPRPEEAFAKKATGWS